jgi:hypothetical protein
VVRKTAKVARDINIIKRFIFYLRWKLNLVIAGL